MVLGKERSDARIAEIGQLPTSEIPQHHFIS